MRVSISVLMSAAASTLAAPFNPFPLPNGFPSPNSSALQTIVKLAGGPPPNGPLPTVLTTAATQTLQLIASQEIFEVAYFTDLLANITNNVAGFEAGDTPYIKEALKVIVNQETIHALAANGLLSNAKQTTITPCVYNFPVTTFDEAIALAQTFTDVVLGVLPGVQSLFAADGGQESALIPVIGAILGQEAQQDGWFRVLQDKLPSASPFLTGAAAQFAFSALQQFIEPGSCSEESLVGITALPALNLESVAKSENSTLIFSTASDAVTVNQTLSFAYLSGVALPVIVPVETSTAAGRTFYFADFPYESGFSKGLTIGALVAGDTTGLNSSAAVAAATVAGPALIEVE